MFSAHPAHIRALLRSCDVEIGGPAAVVRKLRRPTTTQLVLGFGAIYLIWGSTYLGIRYAVETIPPLLMMGIRHLSAGILVYSWARARGAEAPRKKEWAFAAAAGALLFLGGHGVLAWAEQKVASGLAALLCATLPLWTVLIARFDGTERKLSLKTIAGILVGFAGVALLIGPDLLSQRLNWLAAGAVLSSSLLWAIGTAYTRKVSLPSSKVLSAGLQMMSGGALLLLMAVSTGEAGRLRAANVTALSVLALVYLTIFGSIVAFTVYTWLVGVSSPSMVSTYAYVNPVVAVFLGWMAAGEVLGIRTLIATAVILAGVALVSRRRKLEQETKSEPPAFDQEAWEAAGD